MMRSAAQRGLTVAIRHKCFLSYHHADQAAVRSFIDTFDTNHDVFISRAIAMPDDVINSNNPDYIMSRIRDLYLSTSTVTIVLVGGCTWARKFVDWELQASLRQPAGGFPNGLMAVLLNKTATQGRLPDRVKLNYDSGYAKFYPYPSGPATLSGWIDDAFNARTALANLIRNPRDRKLNNSQCP